jgi:hypothetical protein
MRTLKVTTKKRSSGKQPTRIDITDAGSREGTQKALGGSQSDHWNHILVNQTVNTLWTRHSDNETRDRQYKATACALIGIDPKDEMEGMMAAQLLAAHNAAMECYRRAMLPEQTLEGRRENLNQANKLSRTYAMLIDALNRHRGKGQQKMTVEHVHVYPGGQAVEGVVEGSAGTNHLKSGETRNDRQIAHAPQPAMRSPNAEREAVPVAGNAERPVSDARGQVAGRTEGE